MKSIKNLFQPYFYLNLFIDWKYRVAGLKLKMVHLEEFTIEYWDSNSAKTPLILFQAFAAESKYSWHKQIWSFRKNHRLIVPNLIYFGRSTMEPKSYLIKDQVRAISLLIADLKLDKVSLCGSSYGGVVAAQLGLLMPNAIQKLILTNSPLKYDSEMDVQLILDDFGLDSKMDLLMPKNYKDLHKLFRISYFKKPFVPKFIFRSIYKALYSNIADRRRLVEASIEDLAELRAEDYPFQFPILLIWGEKDRLCPIRVGEALKNYFGENAILVTIPKTAHMPNYEKPFNFNRIVQRFLDQY